MNVEIFTLCDFAQGEPTGKFYVIGAFDHINAPQAPIIWPLCAIALRMRFEPLEAAMKTIAISFIDSDGNSVMPVLRQQFPVQIPPDEQSATVNIALVIGQLKLPNFGEYAVRLAIDSKQEGSTPLYVRQFPRPAQLPPPAPDLH
jgi:hypothetical protein